MLDEEVCSSFRALSLSEFHQKYLDKNQHSDGRSLSEFRPCSMQLGVVSSASGSVLMKQGGTTIMVSVKPELCEPHPEKPDQGFIVVNVDASSASLTELQQSQLWQYKNILNGMIQGNMFASLGSLCIKESQLVWILYCDLACLDSDGAILDTCITALAAALKNTKLPEVTYDRCEGETKPKVNFNGMNSLEIQSFPVASTFSCYATLGESGMVRLVSDPSEEEMLLFPGYVTIAVSGSDLKDPICGIWYFSRDSRESFIQATDGEGSVSVSDYLLSEFVFSQVLNICRRRHLDISRLIAEALKIPQL